MSYTREEIYVFVIQRSLEWANWPLYISLSVFPVLLIYIPWWQLLMGVFVLNWIWRLVRCRYQSIGLAMLGAFSIPLRWPISIIMAIYFFITKSYFLSFLSVFWPILVFFLLGFVFVPSSSSDLMLIQKKFYEKIYTLLFGRNYQKLFGGDLLFDKINPSDFMLIQQKFLEQMREGNKPVKEYLKEYLKDGLKDGENLSEGLKKIIFDESKQEDKN
jgi:hypothetical protein